jgi:hypothetical protein
MVAKDVIWITLELEGGFGCKGDGERVVRAVSNPPFAKSAKDGVPEALGLAKGGPADPMGEQTNRS